jgi:hypothetical protein
MANLPVDRVSPAVFPLVPNWANWYAEGFSVPKADGTFARKKAKPIETAVEEKRVSLLIMVCLPGYVASVLTSRGEGFTY